MGYNEELYYQDVSCGWVWEALSAPHVVRLYLLLGRAGLGWAAVVCTAQGVLLTTVALRTRDAQQRGGRAAGRFSPDHWQQG